MKELEALRQWSIEHSIEKRNQITRVKSEELADKNTFHVENCAKMLGTDTEELVNKLNVRKS